LFSVICAALLCASPTVAAEAPGFYAGVIAGTAVPGSTGFAGNLFAAIIDDSGSFLSPTSIVDGGVDPAFLTKLNDALAAVDYPDQAIGGQIEADGRLDWAPSSTGGAVFGYGFGNGWRAEAELSSSGFSATRMTIDDLSGASAEGEIDGSGVWTWTDDGALSLGSVPSFLLDDLGLFTLDTRLDFLLANGWFDFDTGTGLTPYIGAGAGLARVTTTLGTGCGCTMNSVSEIVPAASVGGGVRIKVGGPVTLDFGYRYKVAFNSTQTVTMSESVSGATESLSVTQPGAIGVHAFQVGLSIALP